MKQNYTFMSTIRKYADGGYFLIASTVIALIVANLPATSQWYQNFWQQELCLKLGDFDIFVHNNHPLTVGGFINDFLMAIFFLSVGLGLKREIFCGGELSTVRKAMLPFLAACGGMVVPILIFGISCYLTGDAQYMGVMERGMPIPMATDIAFSLGVLSLFSKRVPIGLKVFLAALAVVDDLGGILVIAFKYTEHISWWHLGGVLLCVLFCLMCSYLLKARNKMVYLSVGLIMWWCMFQSGIHSTIAGVVLAFCMPTKLTHGTRYYIERIRTQIDKFPHYEVTAYHKRTPSMLTEEDIQNLRCIESASDNLISTLQDTEDVLRNPINMFVIPLFAFANAGICFDGMSISNLMGGVGLGVFLGLVIGKFSGVMLACWLCIKTRLVQLPDGVTWSSMSGVAMLCGIGFTVSMFISALSYPQALPEGTPELMHALLNDAKLGILCGTVTSAILGIILLNRTLPRRL